LGERRAGSAKVTGSSPVCSIPRKVNVNRTEKYEQRNGLFFDDSIGKETVFILHSEKKRDKPIKLDRTIKGAKSSQTILLRYLNVLI
jgi:hypothetical protein